MASKRRKAAKPAVGGGDLFAAALEEIAAMGWRETTVAAVAARAGVSAGQAAVWAPTKAHLAGRIAQGIDGVAFAKVGAPDKTVSARDRLFEVLMRRFDALQAHREAIRALAKGAMRDPAAAAALSLRLSCSMASSLAAAGISAAGPLGCARTLGLKAVYLSALRQWLRDDSADMSKTMAALDKALNLAERIASLSIRRGKKSDK